jgi:hypothetical protein
LPAPGAYFCTKCSASTRDVARALAQRRQHDREHVQPVVEVLAERAVGDLLLEIAVRRRHDAHVDLDRLGAADPFELALLQHAQQLDLHVGGRSPTSSRNSVPPSASSKRPRRRAIAPVNDPFS